MPRLGTLTRLTRRLSFRLDAVYLIFFILLLALLGVAFRQVLVSIQKTQIREVLEEEWGALKGYLQVGEGIPVWKHNPDSPEEEFTVERLRRVFLLTDAEGKVLEMSPNYRLLGPDSPAEVRAALLSRAPVWRPRQTARGESYMTRSGAFLGQDGRRYFASIGRALAVHEAIVIRFTWVYFAILPVLVLIRGLLGAYLTRRALQPLNDVVLASEAITSSNLSLRIPPRGAGDELDRLIETFNRMIERLESSFQQMRQFTTDVSHELRTPITAVRGQLEVALMTAKTEEQLREAIFTALEETERLSAFVNAMLQLSRAESGQLLLRIEQQDLCLAAKEILEQFKIPAEEARLRLVAELPGQCMASVDRLQFERMLSNLLANSVKYTPPGGEVRLSLKPDGNRVDIVVEDTGRGIPPEHLPHIFERFYRAPSTDSSDMRGLGLGLSFVAWIVKAHHGKVDVRSSAGHGSRFVVSLPRSATQSSGLL
jgi:heavy metal sensor kinase